MNAASTYNQPTRGPLRILASNPRYFADADGRPVLLVGSHTWANWVEHKISDFEPDFDYQGYLDFMVEHDQNFMRLWGWEHARWATWDGTGQFRIHPLTYRRTGPGNALDGLPKFDLSRFDPEYFQRLRKRTEEAGRRGIYVAVKLFDGFSVGFKGPKKEERWTAERNPYRGHTFHAENNTNGIDGDPEGTGEGKAIHTLRHQAITALHEAFVRKVVDTVNDLDNVLYEICNESDGGAETIEWQYHLIRYIKDYQSSKANQHPVGMTVPYPNGRNATLFASPADWISPNSTETEPYRNDPPAADGRKVILTDTDHIWGLGGELSWVWKSFTRGMNVLLMDPWEPLKGSDLHTNNYREHPTWEPVRRAMRDIRSFAERMDLNRCVPSPGLASTGYCLSSPGRECIVYQPFREPFEVDLTGWSGPCTCEWFNPQSGARKPGAPAEGGAAVRFSPPFEGDAVLYVRTGQN